MFRRKDWYEAEVREKLLYKGYEQDVCDVVVTFLRERRILNDERTLQSALERTSGRRAMGKEKLEAVARVRGAPESAIEQILGAYSEEDERVAMLDLLRLKYARSGKRAQAARFLLSRGFSEDLLESVLDAYFIEDFPQ